MKIIRYLRNLLKSLDTDAFIEEIELRRLEHLLRIAQEKEKNFKSGQYARTTQVIQQKIDNLSKN